MPTVFSRNVHLPPGFIAKNNAGQVTTLKRNGSDYSATILGALFRVSGRVAFELHLTKLKNFVVLENYIVAILGALLRVSGSFW